MFSVKYHSRMLLVSGHLELDGPGLLFGISVGRQVVKIQVLPEYLPAKTTQVPT
jgi:hypothetical protein